MEVQMVLLTIMIVLALSVVIAFTEGDHADLL